MPLKLVTGPANAEKARVVLDGVREAARAGGSPLLVVPTFADVQEYGRELASGGFVFGTRVETFARLERLIAAGASGLPRTLGEAARRRVVAAAVEATELRELAPAAATAGFVPALARLFAELAEQRIDAGRWIVAMRAWGAQQPDRAQFARELGALHGAYADRLRALGRADRATRDYAAHDALRLDPAQWGGEPVFLYGFDDLTAVQRDAVETLAATGAEVVVSLPFEEGREDVYRARAATLGALAAIAGEWERLPALAEDPRTAPALHHLERSLFAEQVTRADPGGVVSLLAGGGERAELELVAAAVAKAIDPAGPGALAPEEVAVAIRDLDDAAPLVESVFADAGITIALERRVPLERTALGRSLIALLRAALPGGTPYDLLTWLRAPGLLERPVLADRLEREVRVKGLRDVAAAQAEWATLNPRFELHELERLRAAVARGDVPELCERLGAEAERLLAAPWRGTGEVLRGAVVADAAALAAVRRLLDELGDLARRDRAFAPSAQELADLLAGERIRIGDAPRAGAVTVADPLSLRARRVGMLVLARLQEGMFPSPVRPEPFLGDAERQAINTAAGLRLPLREDALDAERYLLYATVSRPERRLVLSWHAGDDEGEPHVRSLFVDDVLDCFVPELGDDRATRRLGELAWADGEHAGRRQRALAAAAAAPRASDVRDAEGPGPIGAASVLRALAERPAWSARALEQWAGCPVKWFVESFLRPRELEPDPEALARGELAHDVLQRTLQELGRPVDASSVEDARRLAVEALAALGPDARLPMARARREAVLRRLEVDVLRYLDFLSRSGSQFEPAHFELGFGTDHDDHDPVDIGDGVLVSGRIDRVDVNPDGGEAIVVDYKGRAKQPAQATWEEDGRLQAGLYALALPQLLGTAVVGALYQPIGSREDQRPRGFLLQGHDAARTDIVATDRIDEQRRTELLESIREAAIGAVGEIRGGRLVPRPDTCGWNGGCAYPSICRCESP